MHGFHLQSTFSPSFYGRSLSRAKRAHSSLFVPMAAMAALFSSLFFEGQLWRVPLKSLCGQRRKPNRKLHSYKEKPGWYKTRGLTAVVSPLRGLALNYPNYPNYPNCWLSENKLPYRHHFIRCEPAVYLSHSIFGSRYSWTQKYCYTFTAYLTGSCWFGDAVRQCGSVGIPR